MARTDAPKTPDKPQASGRDDLSVFADDLRRLLVGDTSVFFLIFLSKFFNFMKIINYKYLMVFTTTLSIFILLGHSAYSQDFSSQYSEIKTASLVLPQSEVIEIRGKAHVLATTFTATLEVVCDPEVDTWCMRIKIKSNGRIKVIINTQASNIPPFSAGNHSTVPLPGQTVHTFSDCIPEPFEGE